MSLVDVDSWITEHEACERLSHDILRQMNQRDKRQRNSQEYNRLTAGICVGLSQFETELKQLKDKLLATRDPNEISAGECQRRQRQVEALQTKLLQVRAKFTDSSRDDLIQSMAPGGGGSLWDSETAATSSRPAAVPAERPDVSSLMQQQNESLEALTKSIQRQKLMAQTMGDEVEEQNDLLDRMADSIGRVEGGVTRETVNITAINRKDSTWGLWTTIIVLFITILVVIFI